MLKFIVLIVIAASAILCSILHIEGIALLTWCLITAIISMLLYAIINQAIYVLSGNRSRCKDLIFFLENYERSEEVEKEYDAYCYAMRADIQPPKHLVDKLNNLLSSRNVSEPTENGSQNQHFSKAACGYPLVCMLGIGLLGAGLCLLVPAAIKYCAGTTAIPWMFWAGVVILLFGCAMAFVADSKWRIQNVSIGIVAVLFAVICAVVGTTNGGASYMKLDCNDISVNVVEKVEIDQNNTPQGSYVFEYMLVIANNTNKDIAAIEGEIKIYSPEGRMLNESTVYISSDIDSKNTSDIVLEFDLETTDQAAELYYLPLDKVRIEFRITNIRVDQDKYEYQNESFKIILDTDAQISSVVSAYDTAMSLYNAEKYIEAENLFDSIIGYKESGKYAALCMEKLRDNDDEKTYQQALSMMQNGRYTEAINLFTAISTYKDSQAQIEKCETAIYQNTLEAAYISADNLYKQKQYRAAFDAFYEIRDYKDSNDRLISMTDEMNVLANIAAGIGDYAAAYGYLDAVYYNTSIGSPAYSQLMHACSYAQNENYKDAVALGLTKIVIPSGTQEISNNMFENCTGLKEIVMPDSVTRVGDYAFNGCSGIEKMTISKNLKIVGRSAFANCDGLDKLILPVSLESIVLYGLNSIAGEIHYEGTVEQWAQVTKTETTRKIIYCSNGQVNP